MLDMSVDLYNGQSWEAYLGSINLLIETTKADLQYPIISMDIPDVFGAPFNTDVIRYTPNDGRIDLDLDNYRYDEYNDYIAQSNNGVEFKLIYSVRKLGKIYAVVSLARMVFVTVIMTISLLFF